MTSRRSQGDNGHKPYVPRPRPLGPRKVLDFASQMKAKFPGTCWACKKRFGVGTLVRPVPGGASLRHVTCPGGGR